MFAHTDSELLALHQSGNPDAFNTLYQRHKPLVESVVRRALAATAPGLLSEAPDVCQNVWAWLHRAAPKFAGEARLAPWLVTVSWRQAARLCEYESAKCRDRRRNRPLTDCL